MALRFYSSKRAQTDSAHLGQVVFLNFMIICSHFEIKLLKLQTKNPQERKRNLE